MQVRAAIRSVSAKVWKVRIVLVRYLRSEGRLSQISIGDCGSALGWQPPSEATRIARIAALPSKFEPCTAARPL
jgi:hypothetical protein